MPGLPSRPTEFKSLSSSKGRDGEPNIWSVLQMLLPYPREWNSLLYASPGFPGGAVVKNLPANAGDARDVGLIPGSRRSPGLEDPLEEEMATHYSLLTWITPWTGAWQARSHGVSKNRTWLSTHGISRRFWVFCVIFQFFSLGSWSLDNKTWVSGPSCCLWMVIPQLAIPAPFNRWWAWLPRNLKVI